MQVLPGHPLANTITECLCTVWNNNTETRMDITSKERELIAAGQLWVGPQIWCRRTDPRGGVGGLGTTLQQFCLVRSLAIVLILCTHVDTIHVREQPFNQPGWLEQV